MRSQYQFILTYWKQYHKSVILIASYNVLKHINNYLFECKLRPLWKPLHFSRYPSPPQILYPHLTRKYNVNGPFTRLLDNGSDGPYIYRQLAQKKTQHNQKLYSWNPLSIMSCCKFCIYTHPVNSKFTTWQLSQISLESIHYDRISLLHQHQIFTIIEHKSMIWMK